MIAHLLTDPQRDMAATPVDGVDFCDRCGDCLWCYADDPCISGGEDHVWIVYPDEIDGWLAEHTGAVDDAERVEDGRHE